MLLCFSSKHLSSEQLTPREGKQALVIFFFCVIWHFTLLKQCLYWKSICGEYCQNLVGLNNINWRKCREYCIAFHQSTPHLSNSHQERGSKHLLFTFLVAYDTLPSNTNSKKYIWQVFSKFCWLKNINWS